MRLQPIAFVLVLVAAGAGLAPVSANAQARFGVMTGVVTDGQGLRVDGASVLITHAPTGLKRDATTNARGEFDIVNVQPGTFNIRISKGPSSAERRGVAVAAGQVVRLSANLATNIVTLESSAADGLQLQVVFTASKGGRSDGSAAVGDGEAFTSYITADRGLCSLSAGREPQVDPAIGWRISGQVLSRTDQELNVRITWQRLWDAGVRPARPRNGTLEAAIRLGDRFLLDSVTSPSSKDCGVSSGRLEAVVVPRPPRNYQALITETVGDLPAVARASRQSGRATFGAGGFSGGAAGRGGRGAGTPLQPEEAATRLRDAVADGPLFDAELWLVHTLPDKTERPELIRQSLRGSASFVFPSVRLVSGGTSIDVEVFGFIRRVIGDGGAPSLQVAIGQRHGELGSSENYSGSGKVVAWPAAAEVLSFELPSDRRLPPGHRFDLRVRLTPR